MVSLHRINTLTKTILNISVLQFNFSCLYMQTSCTSLNSEFGNSCETMVWIQWPPQSPWLEGRAMLWTGSDHLVSWLQTWVLFYDRQAGIVLCTCNHLWGQPGLCKETWKQILFTTVCPYDYWQHSRLAALSWLPLKSMEKAMCRRLNLITQFVYSKRQNSKFSFFI